MCETLKEVLLTHICITIALWVGTHSIFEFYFHHFYSLSEGFLGTTEKKREIIFIYLTWKEIYIKEINKTYTPQSIPFFGQVSSIPFFQVSNKFCNLNPFNSFPHTTQQPQRTRGHSRSILGIFHVLIERLHSTSSILFGYFLLKLYNLS